MASSRTGSSNPERRGGFGLTFQVSGELAHAVEILRRDVHVAVVELGRGSQRPEGVDEVRPCKRDQIGAAGSEDRIGVIGLKDIADRHCRKLALVANLVAEGRLEHSAVDRLLAAQVWPADTSIRSAPSRANASPISTASSGVMPSAPAQSVAEMRTDIGRSLGHAARIAAKTSSG